MRTIACIAGVLGGGSWLLRYLLDFGGTAPDTDLSLGLYWVGVGLLAVATVLAGIALVRKAPIWLRLIVGVAFTLLVGSVLETLHQGLPDITVDAGFGVLALGIAAYKLFSGGPAREPRTHGSHSR